MNVPPPRRADAADLPPGLRVGCVRYLNAWPLIAGRGEGLVFDHPAALADDLAAGRLDIALVPTFELLHGAAVYRAVDDVAIACRGPVHSVFLAHRGRLADLRAVRLDPASRTSVNLLRVLLAGFHHLAPDYAPLPPGTGETAAPAEGEGVLLIGDQAIVFRERLGKNCRYFDLGEQWQLATGLPFVFAAWALRRDVPGASVVADTLRAWRQAGCGRLDALADAAEAAGDYPPGLPAFYLKQCLRYRLGAPEKQAIAEYDRLLRAHGLLTAPATALAWV